MSKLEELYQQRDKIIAQIAEVENEERLSKLLPIVEDSALAVLPPCGVTGKVVLAFEYDNGTLSRIALTNDSDVINNFVVVKDVLDDDDDDDDGGDDSPDFHRSKSIGFTVHFADGKVIDERSAKRTMIETFRYIGFERASKYEGNVKGYRIIGREKREYNGKGNLQVYVDGWWIYTCLNNQQKVDHINNIAKMLNISLEIKWKEERDNKNPV